MEKRQRFLPVSFFLFSTLVVLFACPAIGAADDHHPVIPTTARTKRDAREHHRHNGRVKLFVFGDSYLDTGNFEPNNGSWLPPFGRTFPGVPSGRFSDGRVLTDYIADFLGIRTPIAYQQIRAGDDGGEQLKSGVNFAYGGTGVVSAISKGPVLGDQISQLGQMIRHRFYNQTDLNNSVALVAASGNDYNAIYDDACIPMQNVTALTRKLIKQQKTDLRRIHDELGIPKIAVLLMEPAGCLPHSAGPSAMHSSKCNEAHNAIVSNHNQLLKQAVHDLNNNKKNGGTFVILDLYQAFSNALEEHKYHTGSLRYKNPLKPCVTLARGKWPCGLGNDNGGGVRVCKHPELAFFWDCNHPSQNGWNEVYLALQHSLYQLYDA
ncbi:unnamed protein product [Linum tenue]|uniref:GDSL esterase/lipase n=1 Tax=Linum tenue TaxID=586396 RepID=A0AAV0M501_9ROSI|nr:unnamed protein product [Linum tenue]